MINICKCTIKSSFQECTFMQQKWKHMLKEHKNSEVYKTPETKMLRSVKTKQKFEILTPPRHKRQNILRIYCSVFWFVLKKLCLSKKSLLERYSPTMLLTLCFWTKHTQYWAHKLGTQMVEWRDTGREINHSSQYSVLLLSTITD